jgi:glycine cleavage system aminomethyltransferase T
MSAEKPVGRVTAYEISPYLQCGAGFALFDSAEAMQSGGLVIADRDGDGCPIELVELPFYDAAKNIPRGLPTTDGVPD